MQTDNKYLRSLVLQGAVKSDPTFAPDKIMRARAHLRTVDYVNKSEETLLAWTLKNPFQGDPRTLWTMAQTLGIAAVLEDGLTTLDAYNAMLSAHPDHIMHRLIEVLGQLGIGPSHALVAKHSPPPAPADRELMETIGSSLIMTCVLGAAYNAEGRHLFDVSEGLAKQLWDTELRGLRCDDLRLPYPAIAIRTPVGFVRWQGADASITDVVIYEYGRAWHMYFNLVVPVADSGITSRAFYGIDLRANTSLDHALAATHRVLQYDTAPVAQLEAIFRFVVNAVVYATHADAEITETYANKQAAKLAAAITDAPQGTKRRMRLEDQLANMDDSKLYILGKNVRYVAQPVDADDDLDTTGTGKPLQVRVRVQGHWRKQPHGPQASLRKLIWIQPFWRGPEWGDIAPAVDHVVRLKGEG